MDVVRLAVPVLAALAVAPALVGWAMMGEPMPTDWEREVRYHRMLREEGFSPAREARLWRRRFLWSLAVNLALASVLALLALGVRAD